MRDNTSESTKKRMPIAKVVSINVGPNRKMRRHSPPSLKEGEVYKRNIPFINK